MADRALREPDWSTIPEMLARHPAALAILAAAGGLVVCWIARSPLGLAAPVAASFLLVPARAGQILTALAGAFLVAVAAAVAVGASVHWAAAAALALLLGAVVAAAYGDAPEPADAAPVPDTIHPDDRAAAGQAAARAFWSGIPQVVSCRQRQPDGSWRLVELRAEPGYRVGVEVAPLVQAPGQAWTTTDDPGETAAAIRAARVIEELHGAAFAFDAAGRFTYATPIAQTSIAMTLEDLNRPLGGGAFIDGGDVGWKRGVHPEDYEAAAASLRRSLRTGEPFNHEYRVLRATGDYVWHRFAIRPSRADDGRITGWYGIGFDIDVYKRTEAALRERERTLSQLVDLVPSHLWRLTPAGEPVFYNRRMVDFLGFGVADTDRAGMTRLDALVAAAVHPGDAATLTAALRRSLATGEGFAMRYRLRRADGAWRWMSSRAAPLRDEDGRILQWYGLCHDVDDQVQAEEALRLSQENLARAAQAASLAELSASIAHEVNQPLAAIVANSHACHRWLSAEPPNVARARLTAERIVRDANSAAEVVSRVRALFRRAPEAHAPAALGAVIAEARELTAETAARAGVRLEVEADAALPDIPLDRVQIQQVLVNLIRNAFEAMEGTAGERRLRIRARVVDGAMRVEVRDSGPGIAEPDRVFQPFFTTRVQGMGMGLAICRSIVEAHGGRLWAEAAAPHGATLVFTLPLETQA
ncbi:MAG TPA: PAS domain-containing protein [Amaricoccus sp.]|nr:PAS domain-containing protein [Amaricoccus sp.]